MWLNDWSSFTEEWSFMSTSELEELRDKAPTQNGLEGKSDEKGTFEENNEGASNQSDLGKENENNIETENTTNEPRTENIAITPNKKSKTILVRILVVVVGFVLLGILVFLMNWGDVLNREETNLNSQITLEEYVSKYSDGQLYLVDKGYSSIIRGVLPNQEALDSFIKNLPTDYSNPIELNIKLVSDLQNSLNQTFASYDITVRSIYVKDAFEVYGYIHDPILEAEIVNKVHQDLALRAFVCGISRNK